MIGAVIVAGAIAATWVVYQRTEAAPRTDDAEVFANLIGIAPEVNGRIVRIDVKDNQLVHQGDVLFEVDPIPYELALQSARSRQAALEGQIRDLERSIGSEQSAVDVAKAGGRSAEAHIAGTEAAAAAARAQVDAANADLTRAEADLAYAQANVKRLEPLLVKRFVTVDQVDQARTAETVKAETVRLARAHVSLAEAQVASAEAERKEAGAALEQSNARVDQSVRSIALTEPLIAEREARAAAVHDAEYNLERCKVRAPFDARVTNLSISAGAYARVGQQSFTLIDTRTWWVVANFRETALARIRPGMKADVYLMSRPHAKFEGTVESTGFGVTPDASLVGGLSQDLPDVQRSLNWIHLAARFPVRIRIASPSADDFRIGASAMVTVGP
jgi:multidrug efflux system membrane fusion protein